METNKNNRKTILFVSDRQHSTYVEICLDWLRENGHNIITAATNEDYLKAINKYDIDLVLLDIGLRQLMDKVAQLQLGAQERNMHVVMISDYCRDDLYRDYVYRRGVGDCLQVSDMTLRAFILRVESYLL